MRALFYLHSANPTIIHRDIKPENLLCFGHRVKLADFGSSNTVDKILKETICGTPEYLAPEMILKQGHDEKVDIWCFGILLYELIFGSTPFKLDIQSSQIEDRDNLLTLLSENILVILINLERRVKVSF